MDLRKLNPEEHERTRFLYEEVFPEDDRAFVDYYYKWKVKDNEIYVAEDADGIHAMVHLNPFLISVQGTVRKLHYIVAVATQREYRHRGLMRHLLEMAERDMQEAGEEFTFLMPASEQIYLPFGYRFFCSQQRGIVCERGHAVVDGPQGAATAGKDGQDWDVRAAELTLEREQDQDQAYCRPVVPLEYGGLARFVNQILNAAYDVFVFRDEAYYERLQAEQRCQDGEVMAICLRIPATGTGAGSRDLETGAEEHSRDLEEQIVGTFCTATEHRPDGDITELREIILSPEYLKEARTALLAFADKCGKCRAAGCMDELPLEQQHEVPLLMGKVPGGGIFSSGWAEERVFINEVV